MRGKHLYYSLLAVFLLCPVRAPSQTVMKVFSKTPLETVLKEVEKQARMSIIYKVEEVDVNKKASASFENEPVNKVLNKVPDPSSAYTIENKMITIYRRGTRPHGTAAVSNSVGQPCKIHRTIVDASDEPLIGATVRIRNSKERVVTSIDGNYSLTTKETAPILEFSYIGYVPRTLVAIGATLNVTLSEESSTLNKVVITAMDIQRKKKSLTHATQRVKAEGLMCVQDPNAVSSLESKVSGVVITPSTGKAGSASKIILRGNKSVLGSSSPLIVLGGVPMSNGTRGQINGSNIEYSGVPEGADPLSMINPDDIESMNVLKGVDAATLYGSAVANGVVMITTKKGEEGKLSVSVTSNTTFNTPLPAPEVQDVYGARIRSAGGLDIGSWGNKVVNRPADQLALQSTFDSSAPFAPGSVNIVHLHSVAKDDLDDFYRTGTTINNSVSFLGGTEKIQNYFPFSSSHANGMLVSNSYNRNAVNFRQSYNFLKRLHINTTINYIQTITDNRPGGDTAMSPVYHVYTAPRNLGMDYCRNHYYRKNGTWMVKNIPAYVQQNGDIHELTTTDLTFNGPMQDWAYLERNQNNPYWLIRMNNTKQRIDCVFGTVSGKIDIYDGLDFQARLDISHTKYDNDGKRYATTFTPGGIKPYGIYLKTLDHASEIYTDYLLSYSGTSEDTWSVSTTAEWMAHLIKTKFQNTYTTTTPRDGSRIRFSGLMNYFKTDAATADETRAPVNANWDKAALFTAQIDWKDMVCFDASYRQDWYRVLRQSKNHGTSESYGYFGSGVNAIISSVVKLPEVTSCLEYRASYSEVGNSIPNKVLARSSRDTFTGAIPPSPYSSFRNPKLEKTCLFETGIEPSWFDSRLNFDFTFYHALSTDQYMEGANASGKIEPMNSGKIRDMGIETTLGYNFRFGKDWRRRTSYSLSYDDGEIMETTYNPNGTEKLIFQDVAEVHIRYKKGGSTGDMYVTDYKRSADGTLVTTKGERLSFKSEASKKYTACTGNMNSKWQVGWSNTFSYKNFQLFLLVSSRIGGRAIPLTESYLDNLGLSQHTAGVCLYAEQNNLTASEQLAIPLPDGSGRLISIESYYISIGGVKKSPLKYIYNVTNFHLHELSMGYMFQNLFESDASLNVSFAAHNLFFLYKDSPVDPDISPLTGSGLDAFEIFNMSSSRSCRLSMKLTF